MDLKEIQKLVYQEYCKNGYQHHWESAKQLLLTSNHPEDASIVDLAEVGLFATEVTEVMEVIRDAMPNDKHLGEELADIIIRTLNFASRLGIEIESFILAKHSKNLNREHLHGRKI